MGFNKVWRYGAAGLAALMTVLAAAPAAPTSAAITYTASGFTESLQISGDTIPRPTGIKFSPDGRLWILRQDGEIHIMKQQPDSTWQLNPALFISLPADGYAERGLMGITFQPGFDSTDANPNNNWVYIYYTFRPGNQQSAIQRLIRVQADGDVADLPTIETLLETDAIGNARWHNGGGMAFGPDGKLYVTIGDAENASFGQNPNTLFGKVVRLNEDGSIPTDNPFYDGSRTGPAARLNAIYALGLRNPYTLAFLGGQAFINDVGNSSWEEINELEAGANYGWTVTEGPFIQTDRPSFTNPFFAYPHSGGLPSGPHGGAAATRRGCSITGGAFYQAQNPQFPSSYIGQYFFGDYCNEWIRFIDPNQPDDRTNQTTIVNKSSTLFMTSSSPERELFQMINIEVHPIDGSLWYLVRTRPQSATGDLDRARLYQIEYSGPREPLITLNPEDVTISEGLDAFFECGASGNPVPTYQWQRFDGTAWADIPGATASEYTLASTDYTADDGAQFRCVATNIEGSDTSSPATLTVLQNQVPTAQIITPTDSDRYEGGITLNFSGSGTDPEDGALPASAFTWQIDVVEPDPGGGTTIKPFLSPTDIGAVTSGSFDIDDVAGNPDPGIVFRVRLSVVDALGARSAEVTQDILPNTAFMTLRTLPAGLQVGMDGIVYDDGDSIEGVVGIQRTLRALEPQDISGDNYIFQSWSTGGAGDHVIFTPASDTEYTVTYQLAAINVSSSGFDVAEGETVTYRLTLTTQPELDEQAVINLAAVPGGPEGCTVAPAQAVLDATNWDTGYEISVTAVDDDAYEGIHNCTITHSVDDLATTASEGLLGPLDNFYDGRSIANVGLRISDNDPQTGGGDPGDDNDDDGDEDADQAGQPGDVPAPDASASDPEASGAAAGGDASAAGDAAQPGEVLEPDALPGTGGAPVGLPPALIGAGLAALGAAGLLLRRRRS